MTSYKKNIFTLFIFFLMGYSIQAQIVGFRLGVNSGMFLSELGETDILHPNVAKERPAISTERFTPQIALGVEGEILLEASEMLFFGVELEHVRLKGYNNTPPIYNYYLTPYYKSFQNYYTSSAVAFNTTLVNLAVNCKYFLFDAEPLKPFIKISGVVSYIGTRFAFKDNPNSNTFENTVLYARGKIYGNENKGMLPAFHLGGGVGFDYKLNKHWFLQMDATATVVNSDIINGVPNFTYVKEQEKNILKHNKRSSLVSQFSASLVYYIKSSGKLRKGKSRGGKFNKHLPFYRKK